MRYLLAAITLALATIVISPNLAAAQVAGVDSAVGHGTNEFGTFDFSITSGPSGETPSGSATFTVIPFGVTLTATEVTCLSVSGNTATFVDRLAPNSQSFDYGKSTFVDNGLGGDLNAGAVYILGPLADPPACTPITGPEGFASFTLRPILTGDVVIHDAQPLPTSTDQCKNAGWKSYGVFKNQGDCVSFVATGGSNPPASGLEGL